MSVGPFSPLYLSSGMTNMIQYVLIRETKQKPILFAWDMVGSTESPGYYSFSQSGTCILMSFVNSREV